MASYFVKDIGCTLLHLAGEKDVFVARLACKYLLTFLRGILPRRSAQVGGILDLCVKTLSPLVQTRGKCTAAAKAVLEFLLVEQRECLAGAIENLGSLPSFLKIEDEKHTESQVMVQYTLIISQK